MKPDVPVGIDCITFYTSRYYINLNTIASARGLKENVYQEELGQERMSVPPPGEDIVTLAANACKNLLSAGEKEKITTFILATESGIDQSKASTIFVHRLLGLPKRCRVFEVKQACYGATGALQMVLPFVKEHPDEKILIVAADIARYPIGSAGEPTQGSGAVAMIIQANPRLMALDHQSGYYTEDVMDFWRPNYREEALVDGKKSIRAYVKSLIESWKHYQERTGRNLADFSRFCYHLPFTAMGEIAHRKLMKLSRNNNPVDIKDAVSYNRILGNSYAASLYISLTSLLENTREDISGKKIGLFSYGSGCMAEFFSGRITKNYRDVLSQSYHHAMLKDRQELDYQTYKDFYYFLLPKDGTSIEIPAYNTGGYRLAAIKDHKRIYQKVTS